MCSLGLQDREAKSPDSPTRNTEMGISTWPSSSQTSFPPCLAKWGRPLSPSGETEVGPQRERGWPQDYTMS